MKLIRRLWWLLTGQDSEAAAYWRGYVEGLEEMGLTYDDNPYSPRSEAYDNGRTQRRIDEGWE